MHELMYIVVEAFYRKAVYDVLIGYHFEKFRDPVYLEEHLKRIATFWEMQLSGKTSQKLEKPFHLLFTHLQLGIKRGELGRWIMLFHQTLDELQIETDKNANDKETADMKLLIEEWKKRIEFFEMRFKSHPEMFK